MHRQNTDFSTRYGPWALVAGASTGLGEEFAKHMLGSRMLKRQRGGIVLLSSLSSSQGSALIANYTATKAFNRLARRGTVGRTAHARHRCGGLLS